MRRRGELFDSVTAYCGAAVGGVTLFLPITFAWTEDSTPYRISSLINSVPRGAAIGVIVAVAVAVLMRTFAGPAAAWWWAFGAAIALLVNHIVGQQVSAPELLTTQNYVDSVCGGMLLGALGAAALRCWQSGRQGPGFGFALGGAGTFVIGDLADVLHIQDRDPYAVLETPPRTLIAVAIALLLFSALRHRTRAVRPAPPGIAVELPIAPILAATVLALMTLAMTEWLSRQYRDAPDDDGHGTQIGLTIAALALAAVAAAMLLPGRDGAGVLLAVPLVAAADGLGATPRPGWLVLVLLVVTGLGILLGARWPSAAVAIVAILGLALFSTFSGGHHSDLRYGIGSAVLALIAGYCCGTARPHYPPSGVLAVAALFLPSLVTALPRRDLMWPDRPGLPEPATPGRAALLLALCCALGLAVLYRSRPRHRHRPAEAGAAVPTDV
ncbi:hypothetical protein [Nocardia sp. XZ_19_385]|uniref:hypothetical protein n=1 Tax=Nocardia sp. XZ_19_385 TaxID=2769488 RepID=UPI00188E1B3C|nr:hypothetical protein [Nocardia sp. XZ_19_385]